MGVLNRLKQMSSKGLFVVMSGSALASIISFLSSPILSRIATPEAFAYLGILMALFNPVSVAVALRLDTAIPLPKANNDAQSLVWLSWLSAAGLTILVALSGAILLMLGTDSLPELYPPVIQVFPLLMLVCGLVMPLQFWLQRRAAYRFISVSRIAQMLGIAAFSIVMALGGLSLSLVYGYILGWCCYAITLLYLSMKQQLQLSFPGWDALRSVFGEYRHFARSFALSSFLSVLAVSIPVFVFSRDFEDAQTGFLNLSRQTIYMASSFVAGGFIQTYYHRFATIHGESEPLMPLLKRVFRLLLIPALLLFAGGVILGEVLFAWFFGDVWERSGQLAMWIAPVAALQMLATPLAQVLLVIGKVRIFSLWQVIYFVCVALLMLPQFDKPEEFLSYYLGVEALCYIALLFLVFWLVQKSDQTKLAN